jgi:uncharacterized OB-fold protein
MICNNCGKEIESGTKFCPGCGTEVKEEKKVVKKEVKVEAAATTAKRGKGLGIASLILSICAAVTAFIPVVNVFLPFILACAAIVLGIIGLVKKQGAMALIGLILGAVSIILAFIMIIVYAASFGREASKELENGLNTVRTTVKSGYPYGTWTCVPYSSTNLQQYDYENIASGNSREDQTVLHLYTDNTYKYGPYTDSYKNYYKGTFTYDIETDKNNEAYNKSNDYKFIMIKGPITDAMIDGVKKDTTSENRIELEMELFGQYDYDKALIMFTSSYNMYMCER